MKSSNRILSEADARSLGAWTPEDITEAPVEDLAERIESILENFTLAVAEPGGRPNQAIYKTATKPKVDLWLPDELVWTPPFSTAGWFDLEHALVAEEGNDLEDEDQDPKLPQTFDGNGGQAAARQAEQEAAALLAQTKKQAEELLIQAQMTADETLQQAQVELEQARGDGYRQGWAKAEQEAVSVLKAADEIVRQFGLWRDGMFTQSETIIIDMVKQMARAMFGDGLQLDSQALEINLNRVLENAKSLGDLKIYLNPYDADKLDPAWREYQQLITGNRVQVIPSDGIKPGGCFVQGQMGTVDARVETQLRTVLEVFAGDDSGESNA